jgi:hypothetical protein
MRKAAVFLILVLSMGLSSCNIVVDVISKTGSLSGLVNDAITLSGLSGVTVTIYNSTGVQKGSATTNASGSFSISGVPVGSGYYAVFGKSNYYSATYRGIVVSEDETTYLETLLQVNSTYSGTGYASGKITNAFNGAPIAGATLDFFSGINTTSGSLLHTEYTDGSGYFTVDTIKVGGPGYYTVRATKTNYTETTFTVVLVAGNAKSNQNSSMTPNIDSSDYRVILDWGSTPADLDSHLTGPTEGISRFHIYFSNKTYTPSGAATEDVKLDLDDTSSYGPETTTIYNKRSGEYRFYVHDYTNRDASGTYPSSTLSYSGARVRVFRGSTLLAVYNVPTGYYGNCWDVFTLSGATLTPVNAISYISDWATGRNLGQENIFANLPEKK